MAAAVVLIVIAILVGFVWLLLHEILDAIDATTGLVASFSVSGLIAFAIMWTLVLHRLGVFEQLEDHNNRPHPRPDAAGPEN